MSTLSTGALGNCPSTQPECDSSIIESHARAIAGRLRQLETQLNRMDEALDKFSGNARATPSDPDKAPQGCARGLLSDNESELQRLLDRSESLANAIEETI